MAASTEGLKVSPFIRAAVSQPLFVVYRVGRRKLTVLPAHLTQRVDRYVSCADFSPLRSVAFIASRVTLVLVIAPVLRLFVLLAETALGQVGAAVVFAWLLGNFRHWISPPKQRGRSKRNAPIYL